MSNTISPEIRRVLEKIYNLKSSDSVVLLSKQKEIDYIELSRAEDLNKERELVSSIEDYTDNYLGKANAYDLLVAGVDLKDLKDAKQLDTLEDLFYELTATIKEMQLSDKNRTEAEVTLNEVKNRIKHAEMNLQELGLQKEDILKFQESLANYVDRALKLDTGITVGEIHDLLVRLGFEEGSEEIEIAAQLIIFPKTGLITYDLELRSAELSGKSISDVFAEANADYEMESFTVEEQELNEPVIEVEEENNIFAELEAFEKEEPFIIEEESAVSIDTILSDLELDSLEFTNRDKELMEANFNPELFAMNVNTIKTSGLYDANERIIYDYPSFLWDKELKAKLEILTGEA